MKMFKSYQMLLSTKKINKKIKIKIIYAFNMQKTGS